MDLYAYEKIMQRFDLIEARLNIIDGRLIGLAATQEKVMVDLTTLQSQVQQNTDVEQSAISLIQGLAIQIESLKTDPAALQALADQLKSSADNLSAAIVANTPAG